MARKRVVKPMAMKAQWCPNPARANEKILKFQGGDA
jgi:hypothetical protein